MGLLISKANEKTQTIISINNLGIYFQELRLKDRPLSPRVKVGKLAIVDGSIMAEYDEVFQLEALICDRSTLETQVKAAKELLALPDELVDNPDATIPEKFSLKNQRQENYNALVKKLKATQDAIADNPVHKLQSFNAKSMQGIDALVDKARSRHQQAKFKGEFVGFTHYPTKEFFYEQQAREVLKRHNEALLAKGVEDGFIDFDCAMAIVCRRFAKSDDIRKKANAANPLLKK